MQMTPSKNCDLCERLADFRETNRQKFPDKFNAPVPPFGNLKAELLILGLAPGLKGANFTGRPFTADYAGDTLYSALLKYNFATGVYDKHIDDGLTLNNCYITNAVKCVPPENKPIGAEINQCRPFLIDEFKHMPRLRIVLALGTIAHNAAVKSFGHKLSQFKFGHNNTHIMTPNITLIDSYHCSRYNVNTGRLTDKMFYQVFENIVSTLKK